MFTHQDHKYLKLFHCLYHTFLYFGLIDILILKIYFNKSIPSNLTDHINTATFLYLSTLLNHYLIYYFDCLIFENYIYFIELSLLGFLMIQVFLGLFVKNGLLMKRKFEDFYRKRFLHRVFGFFIFFFGKFKMLKIWEYFLDVGFFFYCVVGLYFLFLFGSYFLVYFSVKKRGENNVTKFKILEEKTDKYWNIKKSIENDEFKINNSILNKNSYFTQSQDDSIYKESKKQKKTQVNWFIFENKFYEITNFNHPGGNFILNRIKQKDITKLLYGKKSLIFYNFQTKNYRLIKHKHFYRTFEILKNKCIGPIKTEKIFKDQANNKTINIDYNKSINLFDSKLYNIYNKLTKEKFSKDDFKYNIYKNFKICEGIYLLFISPKKNEIKNNLVYLNNFWVNLMGKYFMLFSENCQRNFFWSVLSYNPNYLRIRERFIRSVSEEFFVYCEKFEMGVLREIKKIGDYEGDEYLSYFYPICGDVGELGGEEELENNFFDKNREFFGEEEENFFKNNSENNNLFEEEESSKKNKKNSLKKNNFEIVTKIQNKKITKNKINNKTRYQFKGPLGIGMGINSYSTGNYLLIIKNEGILPFIDFFEILIQKCLLKISEKKKKNKYRLDFQFRIQSHFRQ